jgi:hypothetical protein
MRLIVVVGYHQDSRASKPFPVYAGRDSAEAEAAMEASHALVFDVIRNPTTVRKRRKTPLPFCDPAPEVEPTVKESLSVEEAAPVVAEAPPAQPDVQPSSGVSGKRGRAVA